jgi:aspartate/methionine/tyrosine aminotransferase
MSAKRRQFLVWMKHKLDALANRDVVNLASSGVSTEFANRWQSDVLSRRASEIVRRCAESNQYGLESLQQAIRGAYNVPADREIVITQGASGGIRLVCEILLAGRNGAEAIIESPVYEPIRAIPARLGAKTVALSRHNGLGDIAPLITNHTTAVFVTNLHNPSGQWLPHDELTQIARRLEAHGTSAVVVVDETFSDMGPHPGKSAAAAHPRIVTISSLSKSHGLGPLRCGWVTADPRVLPNFVDDAVLLQNIGSKLSEVLGAMAIENIDAFRAAARQQVDRNRELVAEWLREMAAAELIEPQATPPGCIIFPRLRNAGSTMTLVEQLETRHDVLVAPGAFFGEAFDNHIRIGFGGDPKRLRQGLARLAEGLIALRR